MSVCLMKSNSAIMSYRTREATISAVQRFDGSRMSGGPLPLKCKEQDPNDERLNMTHWKGLDILQASWEIEEHQ